MTCPTAHSPSPSEDGRVAHSARGSEGQPAYLTGRQVRDWLIDHVEILDEPVVLPTGERVTGIGIGDSGIVLFDGVAVPRKARPHA